MHTLNPPWGAVNARASAWDSDDATRRHLRVELLDTAANRGVEGPSGRGQLLRDGPGIGESGRSHPRCRVRVGRGNQLALANVARAAVT
jgi:hypothetical protein